MITTGGNDFSLPYDFDGIEAENVTVDIIEPPKIDLEKNQPRDVKTQKQRARRRSRGEKRIGDK